MDRRAFLMRAMSAAAAGGMLGRTASARDAGGELTITPLAERLTLISGAGGNVTVFDAPEGVLLVDGGSPGQSARLLQTVRKLTGVRGGKKRGAGTRAVHTLFNTHWHWDQTGSNRTLGAAGTRIIAHENSRLWLATDVWSKWEQRLYKRLPAEARPNQTVYTTASMAFGGEQIDYGYLPQAHTDGDLYVYFRGANVLVVGDVVSVGAYPIIDYCTGGWIGGLANATKALLELGNDATRYVPGKGAVQSRTDVQAEQAMLDALKLRLSKLLADGMSVQDMIDAAPTREFDAKWGDPKLFIANAWPGLVQRARELGVSIV